MLTQKPRNMSSMYYISVDLDSLKCDVQIILDVVGSDPTEAACENECHKVVQDGNVLNYGCPLICHAYVTSHFLYFFT